ncbi:MAG TPA: arylesterase [Burkholderiales bacterium]|nr:arylesterase [Burkholderiales bacterium]
MRFSVIVTRVFAVFWLGLPLHAAGATLMVFGDSLSSGYGLSQDAGWVSLLKQRLQQEHPEYQVINASITGETTRGGLSRIENSLKTHQPSIVILELGGNDGLRGQRIETARDNLEAIIKACKQRRAEVLLIGMRLPPNYGPAYTQKFQSIYPELAKHQRVALMPFMLEGFSDNPALFQPDGIHPAAAAQPLILDKVWKHLRPLLH